MSIYVNRNSVIWGNQYAGEPLVTLVTDGTPTTPVVVSSGGTNYTAQYNGNLRSLPEWFNAS
jgi:hypothetical protein